MSILLEILFALIFFCCGILCLCILPKNPLNTDNENNSKNSKDKNPHRKNWCNGRETIPSTIKSNEFDLTEFKQISKESDLTGFKQLQKGFDLTESEQLKRSDLTGSRLRVKSDLAGFNPNFCKTVTETGGNLTKISCKTVTETGGIGPNLLDQTKHCPNLLDKNKSLNFPNLLENKLRPNLLDTQHITLQYKSQHLTQHIGLQHPDHLEKQTTLNNSDHLEQGAVSHCKIQVGQTYETINKILKIQIEN